MIYLDSCALTKLVLAEKESRSLDAYLEDRWDETISSELALTEVVRVVRRACYDAQRRLKVEQTVLDSLLAKATEILDRIDHVLVETNTFIRAGLFTDDPHLGSLDAIHLVSALEIGTDLKSFVTYDRALARAATGLGLPVEQPA